MAINGPMVPKGTIDAYELGEGRKYSIYNYNNEFYSPLEIAKVKLEIDSILYQEEIGPKDENIAFNLHLGKGKHRLRQTFLITMGIY